MHPKSVLLLFVSPEILATEFVFEGAGAGPTPSYWLAVVPNPTKSNTLPSVGEVTCVALLAKATFPAVADIAKPAVVLVPVPKFVGIGAI
jgi:hypothetical protein